MYFETVHKGEFGVTAGGAHYFGDLNNRAAFNRPKPAFGIFFRKQFSEYISARVSAHYAQLGYSDTYSKNDYQRLRNLSFNTNIYEFAIQGDFNFFKFTPEDPSHSFTPYVTLGVGVFNYDPYAFYNGTKYFLRPLGTEGQTLGFQGRKPYSTTALCIPFGAGIKYNLTEKVNISFEVAHRFTFTDYIDDVSTTYYDKTALTDAYGTTSALMSDPSKGDIPTASSPAADGTRAQRGDRNKDSYMSLQITVGRFFPPKHGRTKLRSKF